jgi:acyl dehydratase
LRFALVSSRRAGRLATAAIRPRNSSQHHPEPGTTLTHHELPRDLDARYFEDYPQGLAVEYGPIGVDEADIIAFGRQFDPQPFHVDPQSESAGRLGGVIASGWHTASLMMRLLVDHFLPRAAGLASPGIDELRWLAPVRPGDQLSLRITVTEARRSRTKPDRGMVQTFNEVVNQRGEAVMTVKTMTLMRCRTPAPQQETAT